MTTSVTYFKIIWGFTILIFKLTRVPLLYPLKTSESHRFSVFRGYRNGTMVENGLNDKIYFLKTSDNAYLKKYGDIHLNLSVFRKLVGLLKAGFWYYWHFHVLISTIWSVKYITKRSSDKLVIFEIVLFSQKCITFTTLKLSLYQNADI